VALLLCHVFLQTHDFLATTSGEIFPVSSRISALCGKTGGSRRKIPLTCQPIHALYPKIHPFYFQILFVFGEIFCQKIADSLIVSLKKSEPKNHDTEKSPDYQPFMKSQKMAVFSL